MLNIPHNPDILTCLADLSSDEVFTPPDAANQMLDQLPKEIWTDDSVTFLDPVSKSGVFLREITKRLLDGLENKIPDIEQRLVHILKKQVFGIATTRLTSQISRRTLYCSKNANGKYSIVDFDDDEGNLKHFESEHFFADGKKCKYCGASRDLYQRDKGLESYAYSFIHEDKPEELFNMKFDVIIGNPPYQIDDGGAGASAGPIYNRFIQSAKRLNPRFMSFIIPARWYSGGKGLDSFRYEMLNDKRISKLHDFQDTNDVFPGLNIRGGICYFLWERDHNGPCEITNHRSKQQNKPIKRFLKEEKLDIFLRHNESLSIYKKVTSFEEESFSGMVSSRKPFGLPTNFKEFSQSKTKTHDVELYRYGENGYISESVIGKYKKLVDSDKVFVPYASPGDDSYPHAILSKPIIASSKTACTETYLMIGPLDNKTQCKNIADYMMTSFFRFMVLLSKSTQHITSKTYNLVPILDFEQSWTDEKLFKKYNIDNDEIEFINSLIKKVERK